MPVLLDRLTVLDGGLSTELEARGVDLGHDLWTARALLDGTEALLESHAAFVRAGARVLISASYQAGMARLVDLLGSLAEARRVLGSTTELARAAFERAGVEGGVVAASLGPFGALLADGSEYSGVYDATWREVGRTQRDRLDALVESEPDVIAIETVPTRAEADTVLEVLTEFPRARAWVAFTCRDGERTWGGDPIEEVVALAASSEQVVALGVNCTEPRFVDELLERSRAVTDLPLVVYPNLGRTWDPGGNCWVGSPSRLDWDELVPQWVNHGARLVGGCCGVGSDDIARLAEVVAQI